MLFTSGEGVMTLVDRIDEHGRAGWIVAMVLGFVIFWPLGLALLGFLVVTRRLHRCGPGWYGAGWQGGNGPGPGRWYNTSDRDRGGWQRPWGRVPASGNAAFDEYRAETLKRLEEEQREFVDYLERLRRAKD